jgi:hypothetical protein
MSVARVTDIKASSSKSLDDAIQVVVARASKTLKNVKGAWVQNQEVIVDSNGRIVEYRVQLKITCILEDWLLLTLPGSCTGIWISLIPGSASPG